MDCNKTECNKKKALLDLFQQKNYTKAERLNDKLIYLNRILGLPNHKGGALDGYHMIHVRHSGGSGYFQGYEDNSSYTVTDLIGIDNSNDRVLGDTVEQCIKFIEYAKRHGGKI